MELVRNDLEQASRTVDSSLSTATTSAQVSFPTNTIANPSTANLTPITSSDLTTPMRLNVSDVAASQTETESPTDTAVPVSRSRKPNWAPSDSAANPDTRTDITDATTSAPVVTNAEPQSTQITSTPPAPNDTPSVDTPVRAPLANNSAVPAAGVVAPSTPEQSSTAEIAALQQEIRQLKSASPSISHDSFMMMKVEVEQLGRDLKKLREEMATQKPTNSVSYDDMMMMRVQIGQITHQLDQLNRQLTTAKSDVEPSA
jgi:hypothetical protein